MVQDFRRQSFNVIRFQLQLAFSVLLYFKPFTAQCRHRNKGKKYGGWILHITFVGCGHFNARGIVAQNPIPYIIQTADLGLLVTFQCSQCLLCFLQVLLLAAI